MDQLIEKSKKWLWRFFWEYPLKLDDSETHRKYWFRTWLVTFVYSIVYGAYEYWVVYTGPRLIDTLKETVNWSIMYAGIIISSSLASRFRLQEVLFAILFMAMWEDVVYFISFAIDNKQFPYPAGDWWDYFFSSFRALGNLGMPISFWPYIPRYYVLGFGIRIGYDVCSFKGPQYSRAWSWFAAPLFIAVLIGAMIKPQCTESSLEDCGPDHEALAIVIVLPLVSWSYILLNIHKKYGPFRGRFSELWGEFTRKRSRVIDDKDLNTRSQPTAIE